MKNIKDLKNRALRASIWTSVLGASFRHVKIYPTNQVDEESKGKFQNFIRNKLDGLDQQYLSSITSKQHIKNITSLNKSINSKGKSLFGSEFKDISFGVCQKLLNLHLKLLWCSGLLKNAPPHFPMDSIIQKELPYSVRKPWTRIDKNQYVDLIKEFEKFAGTNKLAEWELEAYLKRTDQKSKKK